ncbi:lipoxygenase family protein [Corallococcus sp. BB11-1]|uniref:lipoxygenase family protein n=1 Tax=Corallococcus sp. BB11-1 TaxID=2996783 RepID=UPI00226FAD9D|nr:lipoxygenase family protein [Corallococcus sp. BB11-1]MCY1031599.1 lipoxygenase family protein [Corallococcus sp. BB11-1]
MSTTWRRLMSSLGLKSRGTEPDLLEPDELARWYAGLDLEQRLAVSRNLAAKVRAPRARRDPATLPAVATGRLVFEQDGPQGPIPLHHLKVELWDRDFGTPDDFLGEGFTDAEGAFAIRYDPADAGEGDLPDLELRFFEPQHTFRKDGRVVETWRRIGSEQGPDDHGGLRYDFGTVRVPYWEYDPASPLARLLVVEEGTPPTAYAPGRSLAMLKAVAPIELIKRQHLLQGQLGQAPSLEKIQADYPESTTARMERESPGSTRSDAYFGERLLNGMFSSILDRDPEVPGDAQAFRLYLPWNAYEQDGIHCLPDVDVRLRLVEGKLLPVRIILGLREPGATAPGSPVTRRTFTPADGRDWEAAKRMARVSATLDVELGNHLGQCHFNMEQYAIAAHRNLRRNPLRWLLMPHLREVVLINHSANGFLVGSTGYITRASALTEQGINKRLEHLMGSYDWKGFAPAAPVCEGHRYARAGQLFWRLLGEHIDAFFAEHGADISAQWHEVRRFSDDLVAHSAPAFVCRYLRAKVPGKEATWFVRSERMDLDVKAAEPPPKAVSAVTRTDAPQAGELEGLKNLCRYVVFFATFRHAWANNLQWEDAGEVLYSCLGLRWGKDGALPTEEDLDAAPEPDEATEMLWISWMLSKTNYGFILSNEEEDVHPRLLELLRAHAAEFSALGLDVRTVSSRINI